MRLNIRLIIFILVSFSFFSICFAEDFWTKLNFDNDIHSIFYTQNDEIFINSEHYVYKSDDEGYNWDLCTLPSWSYVQEIQDSTSSLLIYDCEYLYRSDFETSYLDTLIEIYLIDVTKINADYFGTTWGRITKANEDWTDTTHVLLVEDSEIINSIIVNLEGTLLAGTTDFMGECGIYKSYDNGDTWTGIVNLLGHQISAMEIDSEGRIFTGTTGNIYSGGARILRSTDTGNNWDQVAGNGIYVRSIGINSEDEIFVGLSDDWSFLGVLYSEDHGDTWEFINEGLGGDESLGGAGGINDIIVSPDGYVYLATDGGLYRSVESTTGIMENGKFTVDNYELEQNHPNPFNNETNISYAVKHVSNVNISIYNAKGQLVRNLVNEKQSEGRHSVKFLVNNLNSGVYYYQLKIDGDLKMTKKMLYLK